VSNGWRKLGGGGREERSGCTGGVVVDRREERARMFWQRAEISRSVLSSVGRVARALEREARDEVRAVRR